MRIAAGVFLIIAAIINLLAAFTYVAGGAVVSGAEGLSEAMQEQAAATGEGITPEQQAEFDSAMDEAPSGGGMLALGGFLFVVLVMQIVGAVQAFRSKAAMLVMVVGGLSILAEVWGAVVAGFGIGNIIGLLAGILAIVAGLGIKKAVEEGGAAPAAAPPAAGV